MRIHTNTHNTHNTHNHTHHTLDTLVWLLVNPLGKGSGSGLALLKSFVAQQLVECTASAKNKTVCMALRIIIPKSVAHAEREREREREGRDLEREGDER